MKKNWDYIRTGNCISTQQPTTGQPTKNRAQSNLFELPSCEGGNRKVTFRASIHTAYRDRKIKTILFMMIIFANNKQTYYLCIQNYNNTNICISRWNRTMK